MLQIILSITTRIEFKQFRLAMSRSEALIVVVSHEQASDVNYV